jgi:hypothetical protein
MIIWLGERVFNFSPLLISNIVVRAETYVTITESLLLNE